MATQVVYIGDGSTVTYSIPFDYDGANVDLNVTVNGSPATFTLDNPSTVRLTTAPASGAAVRLFRTTPFADPNVVFEDTSVLSDADLNTANQQLFRKVEELVDEASDLKSRSPLLPEGEEFTELMPSKAELANRLLGGDDDGNLIAYDVSAAAVATLANLEDAIETLADRDVEIDALYAIRTQITAVQSNASNINTVAAANSAINTLATINANITTLAGIAADVTTAAGVSADVSLVAANIGPLQDAVENLAAIIAAPDEADRAEAAADAAAAAVAGVPAGAATYILGSGPPASNVASAGAFYKNVDTGEVIGPRTAAGWPSTGWTLLDFRFGATFPSDRLTVTRSTGATNLCYHDEPGASYSTFSANQPIIRSDLGLGIFPASRNYLLNSTSPATQTVSLPSAGTYVLWGNGTGTLTSSAGTAVGSGFGVLALSDRTYQVITITTPGTVTVTVSGSVNAFQLEGNQPKLAAGAVATMQAIPTPLIVTGGTVATRNADDIVLAGALLTFLQGSTGSLILQTERIETGTGHSRGITLLGMNNQARFQAASASTVFYFDGSNFSTPTIGGGAWTGRTRLGYAWSGSTVSFGAGNRLTTALSTAHNNGASVTSVRLGAGGSQTYGDATLGGWVARIEYTGSRQSDENLFLDYTGITPPEAEALISPWDPSTALPEFRAALAQMEAGTVDHVKVACVGPSHVAGVTGRANSWPAQLAAQLEARGIAASDDSFFGANGTAFSGGTNSWDPRLTYTGTAPSFIGKQFGGDVLVLSPGTDLTFTPTRQTSKLVLYYYTATGRGSLQVTANGGSALIPVEGGSSTISTNAAASLASRTFTQTLGSNAWTITASGAEVRIMGAIAYNAAGKQILILNGGRSGFVAADLAQDSGPESSYLLPLRVLAPALSLGAGEMTNDMGGTALASFRASLAVIIANALTTGDAVFITDPPSKTTVFSTVVQEQYWRAAVAEARKRGLPVYDFFGWVGTFAAKDPVGWYSDTLHLNTAGNKLIAVNWADLLADVVND